MPVYLLTERLGFPPPELAEETGLLAVGGDLSPGRLILAYSMGIFPWSSQGEPILWWSPDPRLVLFPGELRVSRSLRQRIRKGTYEVTFDRAFKDVIRHCARVHSEREGGTWITDEMVEAYEGLHEMGLAHSVESWHEGKLAGGLYGVGMGTAFFGESMFSIKPDASKVAFVELVEWLRERGCTIIDCQVGTEHLRRFGARDIQRAEFIEILSSALKDGSLGVWQEGA